MPTIGGACKHTLYDIKPRDAQVNFCNRGIWHENVLRKVSGNFGKCSTLDIATHLAEFREMPKGKSSKRKIQVKLF